MTLTMADDYGLVRARQLLELNQVDPAIAVLRDLLTVEPENANARACLAQAYLRADNAELAIEHGQAALALDPGNHWAHLTLAQAYLRGGRSSHASLWSEARAITAGRRAARPHVDFLLSASPDWAPYHRLKASVESGRKTLGTLEAAVALAPEDAATWSAIAQFQFERGNFIAAERAARQALTLDPEDRSSLYVMGMAALRERRFDEAHDNALSILRRWPKDEKGMTLLASAKMGEGRLLGVFFRMLATSMRLEQTRLGKLFPFAMLGVFFVLTSPWDGNPGLTPMRAAGLALMAAWILAVLPAAYLQSFVIYRELSRAQRKVKLREDF
jgi:cellulose synthase operon protein C